MILDFSRVLFWKIPDVSLSCSDFDTDTQLVGRLAKVKLIHFFYVKSEEYDYKPFEL